MVAGCEYLGIDDQGLRIRVGDEEKILAVDNVIVCAGQEPRRELCDGLNKPVHLIGGADVAAELDAKRAIDQGTRLAASL
jgi:2,4-dienoyl-CoA reductase (NADPH2)